MSPFSLKKHISGMGIRKHFELSSMGANLLTINA